MAFLFLDLYDRMNGVYIFVPCAGCIHNKVGQIRRRKYEFAD